MKTLTITMTMPPRFRLIDGEARIQADIHAADTADVAALEMQKAFRQTMETLAAHRARSASARLGWQRRRAR